MAEGSLVELGTAEVIAASTIADTGLSVPADPWSMPDLVGLSTLKSLASVAGSFFGTGVKSGGAPGSNLIFTGSSPYGSSLYGSNPYAASKPYGLGAYVNPAPGTKFTTTPFYQSQTPARRASQATVGADSPIPWALIAAGAVALYAIN